jgi:hypothetical protein
MSQGSAAPNSAAMNTLKPEAPSTRTAASSYLSLPLDARSPPSSQPPSPGPSFLVPPPNVNTQALYPRRVLLTPTVRPPRVLPASAVSTSPVKPSRSKQYAESRLARARHTALPPVQVEPPAAQCVSPHDAAHWFAPRRRFEVVREQMDVAGYQLYAVEKWSVSARLHLPQVLTRTLG